MATWRLTAIFIENHSGDDTVVASKRPYPQAVMSQENGLEQLPGFLVERLNEFGENLIAVTLDASESDGSWDDPNAGWRELRSMRQDSSGAPDNGASELPLHPLLGRREPKYIERAP